MITVTNIEQYTNDIREGILNFLFGDGSTNKDTTQIGPGELAHAFDRATVAALFKASQGHTPPPATENPHEFKRPGPVAGSKAARSRAVKAAATRRENREKRDALGATNATPTGSAHVVTRIGGGAAPSLVGVEPDGAA